MGDLKHEDPERNSSPAASAPSQEAIDAIEVIYSSIMTEDDGQTTPANNTVSNGNMIEMTTIDLDSSSEKDAEKGQYDSGISIRSPDDAKLMYTRIEKLKLRDFNGEVRPMLDIEHYLYNMKVLLDVNKISIEEIVNELLLAIFPDEKNQKIPFDEFRKLMFTDETNVTLAEVVQGSEDASIGDDEADRRIPVRLDPNWLIATCDHPVVRKAHVAVARLKSPVNFGANAPSVRYFAIVIGATEEKATKSSLQLARTLGTLLSDMEVRLGLSQALNEEAFIEVLINKSIRLNKIDSSAPPEKVDWMCSFGSDFWENVSRRSRYYLSDFVDGCDSVRTLNKVLSTTFFLFFSIILPTVAFGALGKKNTDGYIDENRAVIGQVIAGLIWALISGQPMLIIATTALVSLYSKVVYQISLNLDEDFYTVYAWVGIWSTVFLTIYALTGVGNLIRYSTRSVEEVFSSFITICFLVDAIRDIVIVFDENYSPAGCANLSNLTSLAATNETANATVAELASLCADGKSISLASLILMLLTVSTSVWIADFRSSSYLIPVIRECLSDYALPAGVIVWSLIASKSQVNLPNLAIAGWDESITFASLQTSGRVIGVTFALGFAASILFFMDQNITSQIINSPLNRMKKGGAPHADILVIGIVNLIMSFFGLPWLHAVLPHSPLHVICLADTEDKLIDGQVRQVVVRSRETRLTGILCHLLMLIILAACPHVFDNIPIAVLDGLFLYCAIMSLRGNSFYERILLFFTQQSQYPPTHYIRHCPQYLVHWFTLLEVIQLLLICFVGFGPWTYLQMMFPLALAVLIPVRYLIVGRLIEHKYLQALESFE